MNRLLLICFALGLLLCQDGIAQTIRYVKPGATSIGVSWEFASGDLAQTLRLANSGDEVWVAAGNYVPLRDPTGNTAPSDSRTKTFVVKSGVKVYGGFVGTETTLSQRPLAYPSSTTLSGDIGLATFDGDNSYHVVTMVNSSADTELSGFVIKGGNANGSSTFTNVGGGVFVWGNAGTAAPFLDLLIIENNSASLWGGGIMFHGGASLVSGTTGTVTVSLANSTIRNNQASSGGGVALAGRSLFGTFNELDFANNTAGVDGGGLYIYSHAPGQIPAFYVNQSRFRSNSSGWGGGGIATFVVNGTNLTTRVIGSKFMNNAATGSTIDPVTGYATSSGGAIGLQAESGSSSSMSLINSFVSGNTANGVGGGCYAGPNSYFTMTNCTLRGNLAERGGAVAAFNTNSSQTSSFVNTVIWANVGVSGNKSFFLVPGSNIIAPIFRYCDVQDCNTTIGCGTSLSSFDEDPHFTDLTGGTGTLAQTSLCVNTGDPTSTTVTSYFVDINISPRIQGGQIDIGCVESGFPLATVRTIGSAVWNAPESWSCNCVPDATLNVVVFHPVLIFGNRQARSVRYGKGGNLIFSSVGSRLRIGPPVQP